MIARCRPGVVVTERKRPPPPAGAKQQTPPGLLDTGNRGRDYTLTVARWPGGIYTDTPRGYCCVMPGENDGAPFTDPQFAALGVVCDDGGLFTDAQLAALGVVSDDGEPVTAGTAGQFSIGL